jgi:hypothetical protein
VNTLASFLSVRNSPKHVRRAVHGTVAGTAVLCFTPHCSDQYIESWTSVCYACIAGTIDRFGSVNFDRTSNFELCGAILGLYLLTYLLTSLSYHSTYVRRLTRCATQPCWRSWPKLTFITKTTNGCLTSSGVTRTEQSIAVRRQGWNPSMPVSYRAQASDRYRRWRWRPHSSDSRKPPGKVRRLNLHDRTGQKGRLAVYRDEKYSDVCGDEQSGAIHFVFSSALLNFLESVDLLCSRVYIAVTVLTDIKPFKQFKQLV